MKYAPGGVTVEAGKPVTLEIAAKRLRVSVWLDHPAHVIGRISGPNKSKLTRDPSKAQAAKGVLDDISLLTTIRFGLQNNVEWRISTVKMVLGEAIDLCHQNGIQLIAGYSLGEEGSTQSARGKKFRRWLRDPRGPTLKQHAEDIIEFLFDKHGFQVDGIGFDIELNGLKESDADNFCAFYAELAQLLAARNKILTVATGVGMNGDTRGILGTFRAQPFRLAKGHPNVIIRPMAYDNWSLNDQGYLRWHRSIVDYALDQVGLAPGQLQLGLKTAGNVRPKVPNWKPPTNWGPRTGCFNSAGVADRCKTVLRPRQAGVITFAGWIDFRTIDKALNPAGPRAGTAGQPVQVPLPQALP